LLEERRVQRMSYEEEKLKELKQNPNHKDPAARVKEYAEAVLRNGGPIEKGNRTFRDKIQKMKQEDFKHTAETFNNFPIGIHGRELPSFRNRPGGKEYWTSYTNFSPSPHYQSQIVMNEERKYWKANEAQKIKDTNN
jgi:hypothetical protein